MLLILRQILSKADVLSKPLRDNFADIMNYFNNLYTQFTAGIAGTTIVQGKVEIYDCETLPGATSTDAVITLDPTQRIEGTYSLRIDKVGTADAFVGLTKILDTPRLVTGSNFTSFLYVDAAILASVTQLTFTLSVSGGASFFVLPGASLMAGWNRIVFDYDDPDTTSGVVNPGDSVTVLALLINFTSSAITFSNSLFLDDISFVSKELEVVGARDYHTVLQNRIRSLTSALPNQLIIGGAVTVNGDVTKLDIAAFTAIVGGIGCYSSATRTSASFLASAATMHRVDVVVINSDNTVTVISGTQSLKASTNPLFPVPSSTQLSICAVYVDDTVSVDLTGKIYKLEKDLEDRKNFYIKIATTINGGNYLYNNLIIDGTTTLDVGVTHSNNFLEIQEMFVRFDCKGNFVISPNGKITNFGGSVVDSRPNVLNFGRYAGDGQANTPGVYASPVFGGGGGGTPISNGGNGGGGGPFLGGKSFVVSHRRSFSSGKGGPIQVGTNSIGILLYIKAFSINIYGDVENYGDDGSFAPYGTQGGFGGGLSIFIAENDIILGSVTIKNNGGNGYSDLTLTDYGAGGGGGGGIYFRSKIFTSSATYIVSGGSFGTGFGNGVAGENGVADQKLITVSDFDTNIAPFNFLGIE